MYKYYQLILFLVLIGKFDQKSNFQPRLAWLGLIRAEWAYTGRKRIFKSR